MGKMNSRHKSLLELLALFNDTTSGREKAMYARRLQKVAGKLSLLMLGDGVTKQHDIWCSGAYFYFSGADRQKDPWFAFSHDVSSASSYRSGMRMATPTMS